VLKEIYLSDFQKMFDKIFFSDATKRLDLQITSAAHSAEQEEYKKTENREALSLEDFKAKSPKYEDKYLTALME